MQWMHQPFLHAVGPTTYRWYCNSPHFAQELWTAWHAATPWPAWLVAIQPDKLGHGFLITTTVPLTRIDTNLDEPRILESFRRARWIQVWQGRAHADSSASTGGADAPDEWIVPEGMHSAADHHSSMVEAIRALPAGSMPQLALALFEETHLRVV
jgi:hypothetical protein